MKRLFLILFIPLFLLAGFSFSYAQHEKQYNFTQQSTALAKEIFPAIRLYLKGCDLNPYTKEKGQKVVNDIEKIITSNENLATSQLPTVEIFEASIGNKFFFQLRVIIMVFDGEKNPGGTATIVFGKYFFIKSYNKSPPIPPKEKGTSV